MKLSVLRQLYMISKYCAYGLIIQCIVGTSLLASREATAQRQSIEEIQISIAAQSKRLADILDQIAESTDFEFALNNKKVNLDKRIELETYQGSLGMILRQISNKAEIGFKRVNNNIFIRKITRDDERSGEKSVEEFVDVDISGKITDENGEGLPGASVVIKGTAVGTTTDLDGQYKLSVPEQVTIVVSFVGYKTSELVVGSQSVIDVQMELDANQLDEIVVIGYGEKAKRDVTTAISQISGDEITNRFSMSPEMAMQGQMAGVQVSGNNGDPMARPTIRIRGTNTWGVADPVYVVDGVMLNEYGAGIEGQTDTGNYYRGGNNVMALINPADIESITVLKDASAAAIYGVRAANGVVLITTKSGKSGKPKLSFTSRVGWTKLPKHIDVLNSKQYTDFNNSLWATDQLAEIRPEDLRVFDSSSANYRGNEATTDWQSAVENQNAMTQDYSVSFSGGTKAVNYFASVGKSDQDGVYIGNYLDRLTGTFKLNMDINPWLRAGFNARVSSTESGDARHSLAGAATNIPFQPIYDPTGGPNGLGYAQVVEGHDQNGVWTNNKLYGYNTTSNEIATQNVGKYIYTGQRNTGSVYLEVEPILDLKIRGALSIDNTLTATDKIIPHQLNWYGTTNTDPLNPPVAGSLGAYNVVGGNNITNQFDITVNYQKTFGDHNIDILVGTMGNNHFYEYEESYTDAIGTIDPDIITMGGGSETKNSAFNVKEESARFGTFLRTGYNYASKYYVDFSIRRDGSSRFSPEHRWGVFPAVSAAWRLSTESFMDNVSFLNDLKFRAGYGKLGNDEVTKNAYLSIINKRPNYIWGTTSDGYGIKNSSALVFGLPNPSLSWETTSTLNVGFDSRLFNSLDFSFEYYSKLTEGLLQGVSVPLSSGIIDGPEANIGDVSNKGIEMTFNYSKTVNDITFSIGGNLTTQKNEVKKVYGGIPRSTNAGRIEEGQSIGFLRGPVYDGTFQTDQEAQTWKSQTTDVSYNAPLVTAGDYYFKDLYGAPSDDSEFYNPNPDGQVDQFDQTYLGKVIPGYYYGLNFNVAYKGLSLDVVFYGVGDIQRYNNIKHNLSNPSTNGPNRSTDVLNAWTSTNTDTYLPRMIYADPAKNFRYSSLFIEDADYFRLSNVRLSYVFPQAFYESIGNNISNLSVYVGSSNTFTLTGYSGLDPESDSNPAPRMIYAGLSINF